IRRNARYRADDYADLQLTEQVDAADVARRLREALDRAAAFVRAMPGGREGLLFLEGGLPVQPDPASLARYEQHAGCRRGHWPSTAEISSAMLNGGESAPR
ncbi:MAG: hypothetical protein JO047_10055, partial [Alphaproteobacteria bacterium]|nr:hypothetical protein [Alphaproteobacteria bacterium]